MNSLLIASPCGHAITKIRKNGLRYNKTGIVQKYQCVQCNKKFSLGVHKKKVLTKGLLEFCIKKYGKGISLRKIERLVLKKFKVKVSHGSILKWVNLETNLFKPSPYHKKLLFFEKQKTEYKIKRLLKYKDTFKSRYEKLELTLEKAIFRLGQIEKKIKEQNEDSMAILEDEK